MSTGTKTGEGQSPAGGNRPDWQKQDLRPRSAGQFASLDHQAREPEAHVKGHRGGLCIDNDADATEPRRHLTGKLQRESYEP